ncbi:hypothetical protein [Pedobacter soli]|uniref:DUF2116 family Zn-ribbon domain-containing protein n=1 Tax=Pedobacter soli TaxID=390242 RepID=A0A1G6WLN3_9SPHI|nr:hypothetical protein [Pedobacter soli]SDD66704.1 hypothetical protein SAMN04488024_10756 [Pedobacter soli]
MSQINPENQKKCTFCSKILHGRSDQRFCNDTCRNTYNRHKRTAEKIKEHVNTPEIFRIIKKNYEILKKGRERPLDDNETIFTNTIDIMAQGFNPKFFTSITKDKSGMQWYCVFEMGFSIGDEYIYIKDFPEQGEV